MERETDDRPRSPARLDTGGMVAQWLAVSHDSKRVLGLIPSWGLSVWSLHVLPVFAWVSSGCSGFPHHQNMNVRLILQSVSLTKVLAQIWSWSLGVALWLPTAHQG